MKPLLVLKARELHRHRQAIANRCRCRVGIGRVTNPTLVHHGLANAARWHLVTHEPPRRAVADLYVGSKAEASRVARLLANMLGTELQLLDNVSRPAELRQHPRSIVGPTVTNARHMKPMPAGERARRIDALLASARRAFDSGRRDEAQDLYTQAWNLGNRKRNPIPRSIDMRSIRVITRGGKRLLIGCPVGSYSPRRGRCRVGTRRVNPKRRNPSRSAGARTGRKLKRKAYRSRRVYRAAVGTHRAAESARRGALARFGHFHAERARRALRANPKRRKYGEAPKSTGRRITIVEQYWIEPSTAAELAAHPEWPYRMVTSGGQRYGLSNADAIRSQKQGLPFRPRSTNRRRSNPAVKGRVFRKKGAPGWFGTLHHGTELIGVVENAKTTAEARDFLKQAAAMRGHVQIDQLVYDMRTANPKRRKRARKITRKPGTSRGSGSSRARSRRSSNPRGQDVSRAVATFRRWQDRDVEPRLERHRKPDPLPSAAAELGSLVAITYRSDKYDGKTKDHEHVFKPPLASLVTDPEGRDLHIVRARSRYAITPDGITN